MTGRADVLPISGEPVLFVAVANEHSRIVDLLRDHGTPVNFASNRNSKDLFHDAIISSKKGFTPLHVAIESRSTKIV